MDHTRTKKKKAKENNMLNGFVRKKIHKLTLGEKLKGARTNKQVSLVDAEAATKVRARYLVALEAGRWEDLPQEVYVRGFVMAYAKYLGLDLNEIMGLFRIEINAAKDSPNSFIYQKKYSESRFAITPKFIGLTSLGIFVLAIFSYIGWQFLSFTNNPNLKILSPGTNQVVEEESIDISGIVENGTYVLINEEKVPVTVDGHFNLGIKLNRGLNVIKIKATNKTNKATQEIVTIEYKPKAAVADLNYEL